MSRRLQRSGGHSLAFLLKQLAKPTKLPRKKKPPPPPEGARVAVGQTITLCIPGAPRTKKNHGRRIWRNGQPFHIPSEAHELWFQRATLLMRGERLALERAGLVPIARPVLVEAVFFREAETGDLLGYEQALGDWLEPKGGGILVNDKSIASWGRSRLDKDAKHPRIEVTITVLGKKGGNR